jgi:ribosomal protein S18 acetylase RimI-like enzyme
MEIEFLKADQNEINDALDLFKMASHAIRKKNQSQWAYWENPPKEKLVWVREGFEKGEFYFVTVENVPKVAMFRLMKEDTLYWESRGLEENKRYIHSFVVRESHSGKGIGKLVLNRIVKELESEQIDALRLDCDGNNEGLCNYYESRGFQCVGFKKTPYSVNKLYEMKLKQG